jgi:hypothetical protein
MLVVMEKGMDVGKQKTEHMIIGIAKCEVSLVSLCHGYTIC